MLRFPQSGLPTKLNIIMMFFILYSATAQAQQQFGGVQGTIEDSEGRPIPGVTVTLRSISGSGFQPQVRVTPASGGVSFTGLAQGTYTFTCELSGFFTTTVSGVPVELKREGPRLPGAIAVTLPAGPINF